MQILHCQSPRYYLSVIAAPIQRLDDAPAWAKCTAAFAGICQFFAFDWIVGLIPIWMIAAFFDAYYGVRASKKEKVPYNSERATTGFHVKLSGFVLVGLIRLIELWFSFYGVVETKGALAVAVFLTLILIDVESIDRNRERLGARPIPIVSQVIKWIKRAVSALIPSQARQPEDPAK